MSLFSLWLITLIFFFIRILLPKAYTLLCFVNAARYGARAGIYTALGSMTATIIIIASSFFMAAFIFESIITIFIVTTVLGVCCSLYIGITSLLINEADYEFVAIANNDIDDDIDSDYEDIAVNQSSQTKQMLSYYLSGVLISLSSPTDTIIFIVLGGLHHLLTHPFVDKILTAFTEPNVTDTPLQINVQLATLTFSVVAILIRLLLSLFCTWLGARSSKLMMQPKRMTIFNRVIGIIFIGVAVFSAMFLKDNMRDDMFLDLLW